jgi:Uma2 family endonuclease
MRIAARSKMSVDDYLAWEREQPTKHEYFNGEVFAMAGASPRHNALCVRVIAALDAALRPRGCTVLTSDQRVGIWSKKRYVYPDASVVCGALEVESNDVLVNPTILVEVLSKATEPDDRGVKWDGYRRIPSLADYVLVSQAEPKIEHFQRAPDGSWIYRVVGPGERTALASGAVLAIDEIFAGALALKGDDPIDL